MASVGERIREERESRNTSLDDMAVATGIGQRYLESLEKGEYHELPGPAFGKLYIRAYAEVLGFDPQPWIEDYDREHRLLRGSAEYAAPARTGARPMAEALARWRASKIEAATSEPVVEDEAALPEDVSESELGAEALETPKESVTIAEDATPLPPAPINLKQLDERTRSLTAPFAVVGIVIAIVLVFYFALRGATTEPVKATTPAIVTAPPVETAPAPAPVVTPPRKSPPAKASTPSVDLTVTEFGVGRRIVNFKVDGESDHFTEGERVSFSTRVVGGRRGSVLRHVWIYEGRAQQSIVLRLGGSDFRTYTNKTVGKAGAWAVEARDDKGRVLARAEFTCERR